MDVESWKIIADIHIDGSNQLDLHGPILLAPRDIKTTLYYREDRSAQTDGAMFIHRCCEKQ